MARLPAPIIEGLYVEWPAEDEWAIKDKSLVSVMANAVRNAIAAERKAEKGEDKDKSD